MSDRFVIADWREKSVHSILENRGNAAGARRHDWKPGSKRFQDRHGHVVDVRCLHVNVGRRICACHLAGRYTSEERHLAETKRTCEGPKPGILAAATDDGERRLRIARLNHLECTKGAFDVIKWLKIPCRDEPGAQRPAWGKAKLGQVDDVRNDLSAETKSFEDLAEEGRRHDVGVRPCERC